MQVITLVENTINENLTDLKSEHGLSLYIETHNNKILMDTGASDAFVHNAHQLGIDIGDVDVLVISHGHYDHGGGLLTFFEHNDKATVYMHRQALEKHFFKLGLIKKSIGLNDETISRYSDRVKYIDRSIEIEKDIFIITDIDPNNPIPKGNKNLYVQRKDLLIQDDFKHEIALVIQEETGLGVFTGCSHNGIVNILQTVKEQFPDEAIKGLVGGFHLIGLPTLKGLFSNDYIYKTAEDLSDEQVRKIYTGHCTGKKGYHKLKGILDERLEYMHTGTKFEI